MDASDEVSDTGGPFRRDQVAGGGGEEAGRLPVGGAPMTFCAEWLVGAGVSPPSAASNISWLLLRPAVVTRCVAFTRPNA